MIIMHSYIFNAVNLLLFGLCVNIHIRFKQAVLWFMFQFMKICIKKRFILYIFVISQLTLKSQDIHFSQHFHAHSYVNPSFSALAPGVSRLALNSKHQWISVNCPFNTFLASFDNSWKFSYINPSFFSASALIYYDVAGDADFSTTLISPSISYTYVLDDKLKKLLSFGIQAGIAQRSFDITKLWFDSQFDGHTFNPDHPINEIIENQTFIFPTLGFGAHYFNYFDRNTYAGGGLSVYHINKPVVSFKNSDDVRLDIKYVFNSEARMLIKNTVFFPSLYFAKQGPHTEFIAGGRAITNRINYWAMEEDILFRKNFLLGLYYRLKDALIVYAGMEYQNYNLGISYDINLSKLTPASHARGGFEFSASYLMIKKKFSKKEIPCPIF